MSYEIYESITPSCVSFNLNRIRSAFFVCLYKFFVAIREFNPIPTKVNANGRLTSEQSFFDILHSDLLHLNHGSEVKSFFQP